MGRVQEKGELGGTAIQWSDRSCKTIAANKDHWGDTEVHSGNSECGLNLPVCICLNFFSGNNPTCTPPLNNRKKVSDILGMIRTKPLIFKGHKAFKQADFSLRTGIDYCPQKMHRSNQNCRTSAVIPVPGSTILVFFY